MIQKPTVRIPWLALAVCVLFWLGLGLIVKRYWWGV